MVSGLVELFGLGFVTGGGNCFERDIVLGGISSGPYQDMIIGSNKSMLMIIGSNKSMLSNPSPVTGEGLRSGDKWVRADVKNYLCWKEQKGGTPERARVEVGVAGEKSCGSCIY